MKDRFYLLIIFIFIFIFISFVSGNENIYEINGTIFCHDANVGDTGVVNGITCL